MDSDRQFHALKSSAVGRLALLALCATATVTPVDAVRGQTGAGPARGATPAAVPHMAEALRTSIETVVVIAGRAQAQQEVTGTYEKDTLGAAGGAAVGSSVGSISKQIGGVPVYFPIPGVALPGAIIGGIAGATQREIQEFRDALTEQLAAAESQPLTNDGLALDVFWGLRELPGLDTKILAADAEIPGDTDAVLYVSLEGLEIDVRGKEAVITTLAAATLRRAGDGRALYDTVIAYRDRDTLGNWTEDDNALWRSYVNYARHALGRELAADTFGRIEPGHALRPLPTDTAKRDRKDERRFVSRSPSPTLAWELDLEAAKPYGPWTDGIDESRVFYDVEIYDARQLVYFEERIPDPRHAVAMELEPCGSYRWSVRPSYHVGGDVRYGEWMRFEPRADAGAEKEAEAAAAAGEIKGIVGRRASAAPAYVQDYAVLDIACGRR